MVIGETQKGTVEEFTGEDDEKGGSDNSSPAVEQLFADEVDGDDG